MKQLLCLITAALTMTVLHGLCWADDERKETEKAAKEAKIDLQTIAAPARAAASCVGLGLRVPATASDAADLAPPVAVWVGGVPIDVAGDAIDDVRGDNSFPWLGDFHGDGKLDLLIGQHGRAKSREGHLRIYRNLGGKAEPQLAEPIWFDDQVPTGLIPHG